MTEMNPWARIIGPCYTIESFARTIGWTTEQVRAASQELSVLELESEEGVLLYPAFQLSNGAPVEGLAEVLRILQTGTSGRWTWAQWLNTPLPDADGVDRRNIDLLREGRRELVLLEARHYAWSWSS